MVNDVSANANSPSTMESFVSENLSILSSELDSLLASKEVLVCAALIHTLKIEKKTNVCHAFFF